jgi:hypothetical protein
MPMLMMRTGDRVWVTFAGRTTVADVVLASDNGRSAMLRVDAMLGGYVGLVPILWAPDAGIFVDLIGQDEVVVTPYPS